MPAPDPTLTDLIRVMTKVIYLRPNRDRPNKHLVRNSMDNRHTASFATAIDLAVTSPPVHRRRPPPTGVGDFDMRQETPQ